MSEILYDVYDTPIEQSLGGTLIGTSILLTIYSLVHMAVLRSTASKYYLFPIVNLLLFICELLTIIKLVAPGMRIWTTVARNGLFVILRPAILCLAFLRCQAVYAPCRKHSRIHYSVIAVAALQVTSLFIASTQYSKSCQADQTEKCATDDWEIIYNINDIVTPALRFYYILLEGIFLVVVFSTFRRSNLSEDPQIVRERRFRTFFFCLDLFFLTFSSIYHLLCIFKSVIITYEIPELFSIAFTVFCMTEFGLIIPKLFKSVRTRDIELRNHLPPKKADSISDELVSNIGDVVLGEDEEKQLDSAESKEVGSDVKEAHKINEQGSVSLATTYNTNNTSFVSNGSEYDLATRDVSSMRLEREM
ncbi:4828_t:CDS:1 [Paraglomus brasilianum]|uniref:4828_t:CDS:1 n=1 Tax=Paraglomus brasilianum TaxID=144538 RepID=A0A9N8ZTI1_9GLOM|nr:4828_t:CDS:1 [Paraglomus brasilianum]